MRCRATGRRAATRPRPVRTSPCIGRPRRFRIGCNTASGCRIAWQLPGAVSESPPALQAAASSCLEGCAADPLPGRDFEDLALAAGDPDYLGVGVRMGTPPAPAARPHCRPHRRPPLLGPCSELKLELDARAVLPLIAAWALRGRRILKVCPSSRPGPQASLDVLLPTDKDESAHEEHDQSG